MSGDDDTPPGTASGPQPAAIPPDRAVLDRVVDGTTAVLLVGEPGDELRLPAHALPDGAADGTWLVLDLSVDPVEVVGIDPELTAVRARDVSSRMTRLRERRRGGRFGR